MRTLLSLSECVVSSPSITVHTKCSIMYVCVCVCMRVHMCMYCGHFGLFDECRESNPLAEEARTAPEKKATSSVFFFFFFHSVAAVLVLLLGHLFIVIFLPLPVECATHTVHHSELFSGFFHVAWSDFLFFSVISACTPQQGTRMAYIYTCIYIYISINIINMTYFECT